MYDLKDEKGFKKKKRPKKVSIGQNIFLMNLTV